MMTKTNTHEGLQQRLQTMKLEMTALLERTTGDCRPVDLGLPIGRLSRADAIQMQNMATLNQRQLETKLKQVETALSAFEEGLYGTCKNCNGEINPERLDARPETPFCIDCQDMFEQR